MRNREKRKSRRPEVSTLTYDELLGTEEPESVMEYPSRNTSTTVNSRSSASYKRCDSALPVSCNNDTSGYDNSDGE